MPAPSTSTLDSPPSASGTMLSVVSSPPPPSSSCEYQNYQTQHLPRRSSATSHRTYLPPPADLVSGRRASTFSLRDYQLTTPPPAAAAAPSTATVSTMPHRITTSESNFKTRLPVDVMQALEIARESEDGGAGDSYIAKTLDQALDNIWDKVKAQPDSYIMSDDEYSLFNYFQHRFIGNDMAVLARRRYWDNTTNAK